MIYGIVRATRWDPDEEHTSKGTRYLKTGSARVEVTIPSATQSIHDLCNQPVIITTQPELDALLASARADAARAWERVRVLEARINTVRETLK